MPAGPGETHLTTLYADVHYYFSNPTSKPLHHRFDRSSYVYLFHNATNHQAKLEIANNAGTPDQDAFSGYLDVAALRYSFKQPHLCTLTVNGAQSLPQNQWHLPTFDMRNEQKYLYKIHSLDIYLWTEKDAATLLGHLKAVMPSQTQDIRDAPSSVTALPTEHRSSMSPVVQQLEKTAISTPYSARAGSTVSSHSIPGPPPSVGPPKSPPIAQPQPQAMAYNPAAPAAPEPIAHREKTPPLPEDGSGPGLSNVARYDSMSQNKYSNVPSAFGPSSSQYAPQQQSYFSGPPQQSQGSQQPMSFPGPPQGTPPVQRAPTNSFPPPPPGAGNAPTPPNQRQQSPPSFAPPPTSPPPMQTSPSGQPYGGAPTTQYAHYNPHQQHSTPSFGPSAVASPGMPSQEPPTPSAPPAYSGPAPSSGFTLPSSTTQPHAAQQQIFSYSNYSYNNPQQQQQQQGYPTSSAAGGSYTGDVHSQLYRPTEAEALHGHGKPVAPPRTNTSESRGRIEGKVDQVEKKVGGFLKKLDKMW